MLDLDGFATKRWSANLYHAEVPVTDLCCGFEKSEYSNKSLCGKSPVSVSSSIVSTSAASDLAISYFDICLEPSSYGLRPLGRRVDTLCLLHPQ